MQILMLLQVMLFGTCILKDMLRLTRLVHYFMIAITFCGSDIIDITLIFLALLLHQRFCCMDTTLVPTTVVLLHETKPYTLFLYYLLKNGNVLLTFYGSKWLDRNRVNESN